METTTLRPRTTRPPVNTFRIDPTMIGKTDPVWSAGDTSVRVTAQFDIDILSIPSVTSDSAREHFRLVAKRVLEQHPNITFDEKIKDIPTLKGNRISVGQILGRLYVLNSVDAVVEFYHSTVSREQVKDAIAFAQDFLEAACEPI
jgi:uncharacterized protein (DUF433 family)